MTQPTTEEMARIFDADAADLATYPLTIPAHCYLLKVIRAHIGEWAGKRILDVGCGRGRYLRVFQEQEPDAELWGLDISAYMLRDVPQGINTQWGSMLAMPFVDGQFDGAYAVESFEHAIDIDKAVSEICRVVKPGGRIVIIDKNQQHWDLLRTKPWEQWFHKNQLTDMLLRHCVECSCRPIQHWENQEPNGLFLAWEAVK